MPRLPKYRLHRGSGRGCIEFKPFFGDKRLYLPGAYGSPESIKSYHEWMAKISKHLLDEKKSRPATSIPTSAKRTLSDMAIACLAWADGYYNGSGEADNLRYAIGHLFPRHKGTLVDDFTPRDLESVRELMIETGLCRNTINARVRKICRVFKWAVKEGYCTAETYHRLLTLEPLTKGRSKARETKPVKAAEWDAVERILPHLSPTVRAMVQVHWYSGMRSDELCQMSPCNIDTSGKVWLYSPGQHKNDWREHAPEKIVCLGPKCQAILRPFLKACPSDTEPIFSPQAAVVENRARRRGERADPSERVVAEGKRIFRTGYDSKAYQHAIEYGFRSLARELEQQKGTIRPRNKKGQGRKERRPLKPMLKELKIVYWHPHQLRHSRSTTVRKQHGLEGVQAVTGNSFEAAKRYAEVSLELAVRIASESG